MTQRLRRYAYQINKMLKDMERNPDWDVSQLNWLIQEFRDTEILQEILSDDPQLTLNNLRGN